MRKRKKDIPALIDHLLEKINKETELEKKIAHTAISLAQREDWPGNVRQLNSALRRAAILGDGDTISRSDLKAAIIHVPVEIGILDRPLDDGFDLQAVLDEVSIHYIERAKEKHNHNKSEVADSLGFNSGTTLANWLTKLDIEW
jgi:DNA-binding NtrC family response regulator